MTKIITVVAVAMGLVGCKGRTVEAASVPTSAPAVATKSAFAIKPETKVRLLVYQAKLRSIEDAIDQSPFGQQRKAVTPKFQAELAAARNDCHGGEPIFGEDDVVCSSPPKK